MGHHLQISFDLKIITVNQYGKGSLQANPTINLLQISEKYGIPTGKIRRTPYSFLKILSRELT